ncbi:MAG TPA: hypothetical protein VFM60_08070 [Salinimicrobium sp.]|nr:hypothetical protein [Salinimicrobium sp.]
MEAAELKSKIINYIEHADERVLRVFLAIMEDEKNNLPGPEQDLDSQSEHQRKISENEKSQEEGMGSLKDDHRLK